MVVVLPNNKYWSHAMYPRIKPNRNGINLFLSKLASTIVDRASEAIASQLETEVSRYLYRQPGQRRSTVSAFSQASCQRCGSQRAADFTRNGYRQRQLVTSYGVLRLRLPRVRCQCGDSVKIPFAILKPYQRIWTDLIRQIGRWADLGLSLRQMQYEIGEQIGTQVGLRCLNQAVHQVEIRPDIQLSTVPAIVLLDAIWVSVLEDSGQRQFDSLGRQRAVKVRQKVCALIA